MHNNGGRILIIVFKFAYTWILVINTPSQGNPKIVEPFLEGFLPPPQLKKPHNCVFKPKINQSLCCKKKVEKNDTQILSSGL